MEVHGRHRLPGPRWPGGTTRYFVASGAVTPTSDFATPRDDTSNETIRRDPLSNVYRKDKLAQAA